MSEWWLENRKHIIEKNRRLIDAVKKEDLNLVNEALELGGLELLCEEMNNELDKTIDEYWNEDIYNAISANHSLHYSLIDAVIKKDIDSVNKALKNGANINYINWEDEDFLSKTSIGYAVDHIKGIDIEIVKAILNTDQKCEDIDSVLTDATFSEDIELMKLLLDNGADINYSTYEGTPLYFATREKDVNMVKFLLENGADMYKAEENSSSPIEVSLYLDDNYEINNIFNEWEAKNK